MQNVKSGKEGFHQSNSIESYAKLLDDWGVCSFYYRSHRFWLELDFARLSDSQLVAKKITHARICKMEI